jgi:hypothetical protein
VLIELIHSLEQGGCAQNQTYGLAMFGENVEEGKGCTS